MNIVKSFSKFLTKPQYPKRKVDWQVKGRLKNSNRVFKFEVKEMFKREDGFFGRHGNLAEKADKKVFRTKKEWVVVDIEELHNYLIKNKITVVHLEDLISKLEWNIILPYR